MKNRAVVAGHTLCGEFQRTLGLRITSLGSHRLAIEQWKQVMDIPREIRGRVLITALRNRSWIGVGVYTACVLRQMGYTSTLLYRGSEIRKFFPSKNRRFGFWPGVATIDGIRLVDVEAISVTQEEQAVLAGQTSIHAPSALAYDLHLEETDVLNGDAEMKARLEEMARMMMRIGAATRRHLEDNSYHRFILYSGLIGESPIMLACAQQLKVPTVCLEGWGWRAGHMLYNYNAPALDYDIQGWLDRIQPWTEEKEQEVNKYISFLDGQYTGGSEWLDNFYQVQRAQISEALPLELRQFLSGSERIFLAAPNVIGDSSMLRRETIFAGQQEWCRSIIQYFRGKPDMKLIVRAHPAEVWVSGKVRIRMEEVARQAAAGAPNILVIGAHEKVNTFTLLPFIHAGLVWLSSAGVDMVVRGIPVIAAARPKYTGLGIVEELASHGAYMDLLDKWCGSCPRPAPEQVAMAKRYLYIVFKGFSFEAWGRNTFATSCRLDAPANPQEHEIFYRALVDDPRSASPMQVKPAFGQFCSH